MYIGCIFHSLCVRGIIITLVQYRMYSHCVYFLFLVCQWHKCHTILWVYSTNVWATTFFSDDHLGDTAWTFGWHKLDVWAKMTFGRQEWIVKPRMYFQLSVYVAQISHYAMCVRGINIILVLYRIFFLFLVCQSHYHHTSIVYDVFSLCIIIITLACWLLRMYLLFSVCQCH